MKSVCEIVVLLDRSGSMETIKSDTEGGFNNFMDDQRKVPGACFVSLFQFDNQYEEVYLGRAIDKVPRLRLEPRGSTALLDAMGKTLRTALTRITDERKVIVLVLTDGQENASREHKKADIKALVEQAEKRGWQLVFVGAGFDAFAEAGQYGFAAVNTISAAANKQGTQEMYHSLSVNTMRFRSGAKADMSWEDEDRQKQEKAKSQPT